MIKLTKEQETAVANELQYYFESHTDFELSQIAALQLIDFLNEKVGKYYYNRGIADAEAFLSEKVSDLVMLEKE
ncbi:MAG: DUF2164 domain-containing protein [Culicoidibacterales bacterium]